MFSHQQTSSCGQTRRHLEQHGGNIDFIVLITGQKQLLFFPIYDPKMCAVWISFHEWSTSDILDPGISVSSLLLRLCSLSHTNTPEMEHSMHPFSKVNTRKLICSAPGCFVGKDHSERERERERERVYVCEKERKKKGSFLSYKTKKGSVNSLQTPV